MQRDERERAPVNSGRRVALLRLCPGSKKRLDSEWWGRSRKGNRIPHTGWDAIWPGGVRQRRNFNSGLYLRISKQRLQGRAPEASNSFVDWLRLRKCAAGTQFDTYGRCLGYWISFDGLTGPKARAVNSLRWEQSLMRKWVRVSLIALFAQALVWPLSAQEKPAQVLPQKL